MIFCHRILCDIKGAKQLKNGHCRNVGKNGGLPNNEDGGIKTFPKSRGFFAAFKIFFETLMMRTFTLPPRGGLLLLLEIGAGLLGKTIVRIIDFVLSY